MAEKKKTPVTMLSGFLGAGKTCLLRYVLENSTEKIACIVNDVASINIDAKLVRNDRNRGKSDQASGTTKDLADTVELQNGCACCNLQDELFASFEQILTMADQRGEPYARIVLENSGVAEPQNIRDKFNEAAAEGHPLMDRIELDTLVTVVDSGTFMKDYASKQPLAARPDLGDGGNLRPVVDLLVEQIECADFIVLNKTDLLEGGGAPGSEALDQLVAIVSSLNPLAAVVPCTQGQVPIAKVFGSEAHAVVAKLNIEGQHRGAVAAARSLKADKKEHKHEHGHGHHDHHHDHDHKHEHDHGDCSACKHEHKHEHKHSHEDHDHHDDCAACKHEDEHHHDHGDCKECKHEHEGEHKHSHDDHAHHDDCAACKHDHDHHHEHKHSHEDHDHHDDCSACKHEGEHGHHHHHHHHHERAETRAASRFGIRSFVYSRRKPFHPQRLKEMVLKWLPVTHNQALDAGDKAETGDSPIKSVLRSKGFMWMSNSHTTAYYWSHAGTHFEIRDEGDWWSAVPEEDWPEEGAQKEVILQDFDLTSDWGDRRQEIVFIGVGMDEAAISTQLDGALLTDEEMDKYRAKWSVVADPPHPAVEERKAKKARSSGEAAAAPVPEHHKHQH